VNAISGTIQGSDLVDLRPFMAKFPTGVGIITTFGAEGRPWGLTCTSMCSVTLEPPTILVCLRRGSPTLDALLRRGAFALNLLNQDGRPAAELFASGAPDRFARIDWHHDEGCGGPHLSHAAHDVADCRVARAEPVGDHTVVFGEVVRVTQRRDSAPLLFGLRRYAAWPAG
jgi:flavin reductase (NADH)